MNWKLSSSGPGPGQVGVRSSSKLNLGLYESRRCFVSLFTNRTITSMSLECWWSWCLGRSWLCLVLLAGAAAYTLSDASSPHQTITDGDLLRSMELRVVVSMGLQLHVLPCLHVSFLVLFWHPSPPPVTHRGVIPASETSRLLRPGRGASSWGHLALALCGCGAACNPPSSVAARPQGGRSEGAS